MAGVVRSLQQRVKALLVVLLRRPDRDLDGVRVVEVERRVRLLPGVWRPGAHGRLG